MYLSSLFGMLTEENREALLLHLRRSESGARPLEGEGSLLRPEKDRARVGELEKKVAECKGKLKERGDRITELQLEVGAMARTLETRGGEVEAGRTKILALEEELAVTKKVVRPFCTSTEQKFPQQFQPFWLAGIRRLRSIFQATSV